MVKKQNFNGSIWSAGGNGIPLSQYSNFREINVHITSWQIEGGNMETVTNFIFLGSKIIADGDCSHEIKRHTRKIKTNTVY